MLLRTVFVRVRPINALSMPLLRLMLLLSAVKITNIPELPPEHRQDGEDTPRLVTGQAREVVYEESGRTLAVTLHEVRAFSKMSYMVHTER